MRQKKVPALSVIVPCYNEEKNVTEFSERALHALKKNRVSCEIIFVDDGSRDGTAREIKGIAERSVNARAVFHKRNRGISEAWKSGISASRSPVVCVTDADLQYLPEDIPKLYRTFLSCSADIVQGWRSRKKGQKGVRWLMSRTMSHALNFLFGMRLKDNKSGFFVCKKETLSNVLNHKLKYMNFFLFITVAAKAHGYKIREVKTHFARRKRGKSFIPLFPASLVFWAAVDIAKAVLEYKILRIKRIGRCNKQKSI